MAKRQEMIWKLIGLMSSFSYMILTVLVSMEHTCFSAKINIFSQVDRWFQGPVAAVVVQRGPSRQLAPGPAGWPPVRRRWRGRFHLGGLSGSQEWNRHPLLDPKSWKSHFGYFWIMIFSGFFQVQLPLCGIPWYIPHLQTHPNLSSGGVIQRQETHPFLGPDPPIPPPFRKQKIDHCDGEMSCCTSLHPETSHFREKTRAKKAQTPSSSH